MKYVLVVFWGIFLISNFCVLAESTPVEEIINQINEEFFVYEQNQDFNNAANIFHYPPSYSNAELVKDKTAVKLVLEYFNKSFGRVVTHKIVRAPELNLSLSIGGGNLPYWTNNPRLIKTTYEVQFSNDGKGYVVIDLCKIGKNFEVRAIHYGLPLSRKDTPNRIQEEIFNGMMVVLKGLE